MKKAFLCSLILFIFCTSLIVFGESPVASETVRGRIIEITKDSPEVQEIIIEIRQGTYKGQTMAITHTLSGNPARDFYFQEGEGVLLWIESQGGVVTKSYITEVTRDHYLGYLTLFFVFSLILIGGLQGLKTVITLGITGFLVLKVLIPLILGGYPPILITIIVASIIVTATVVIISGFNKKALAAIIGTIGGVVIAGMLAWIMTQATRLTGLSGDESQMLMYIPQRTNFDFTGLLFAGMIIGAVGAVLDVGMSIASAIDEVRNANPAIKTKDLIKSGLNVGKDIMGTMANTLILAYTGASMSLLLVLVAYEIPFARVVNMDAMATEIVRVLAGSIGLIYAIPITAIVAGMLYQKPNLTIGITSDKKCKKNKKIF
ncbi:Uncharacterized membrane protein [Natronincola peptidivorans]|uniref:Uncharacterized membrane protein n=1 Tax=Natronincola peptidivorans TaxID=426128 RepID=A0A1H9Y3U1_9FIRM|nr:YibE/F family protein [Natronincola peptidivorans]SES63513.1 Uncharacterized membrane protein [Natronincola peptidivorans]